MTTFWLDANVVLRFLTREPAELAERARRLMARADAGELTLFVSELVVAEVVWVLKSFYGHSLAEIAAVVGAFVSASGIRVDDRETTLAALELARDHNVDYIDAVLALKAAANGETICTFDETDFKRLPAQWIAPQ